MLGTLVPFSAAVVALLAASSLRRAYPRGASGALLQWGALAGWNGWLLAVEVRGAGPVPGWVLAAAAGAVAGLLLLPRFLLALADTQIRIGRTGPVGWLLALRFLVCWHRRHLLDWLVVPVRLAVARGAPDAAVAAARRLQGSRWLRGLEPEQAEVLAYALIAAGRFVELRDDPAIQAAAPHHVPVSLSLARARAESGDLAMAAADLHALDGADPARLALAWAHVLSCAGQAAALEAWTAATGLAGEPRLESVLAGLRARAAHVERPVPVEPPAALPDAIRGEAEAGRDERAGPATAVLAGAMLVGAGAVFLAGASDEATLVRAGAVAAPLVLAGEAHRLFVTTVVHDGPLHLLMNLLTLLVIGPLAERLYGGRLVIGAWVASAAGGGIASCLAGRISVGASGAILGLAGAACVTLWRRPDTVPAGVRRRHLRGLSVGLALVFVYGLVESRVDNAGHLGGLVTGALLGLVLPPARALGRPLGLGALAFAAIATAVGCVALLQGGIAFVCGAPLPADLPSRIVDGPEGRLRIPEWWESSGDAADARRWSDPVFGLEISLASDDGTPLAEVPTRWWGRTSVTSLAVEPSETLPSGVVRVTARVETANGWQRGHFLRASRGGRAVVLRASGPGSMADLFGPLLADLAAQATPGG